MKHKVVYIVWLDSIRERSSQVWIHRSDFKKELKLTCESIGYLVFENKNSYVVASHKSEQCFSGNLRIPKRSVVSIKQLKVNTL